MFSNSRRFSVNGSSGSMKSIRMHTPTTSIAKSSASKETANLFGSFGLGGITGNSSMSVHSSGPITSVGMLDYLVPQQEDMLRKYYRDMYYYDPVCGSAIDLLSTFPFSEYTLTGCDQPLLDKYEESLSRLNIRALMPDVSTTYLVDGSFVCSLIFNKREKIFIDVIIYPIDDCKVDPVPFYSADPIITVKNSESMMRFMTSKDTANHPIQNLLPSSLRRVLTSQAFKLDPLTTLYMARRTLPGAEPASFLKRCLPIYLLEKTLYRGTLVEAMKRQRSMLHVQMGDDTHEFTSDEMAETVNQFQLADLDPLGAVIGTRNNVQASELRQGGDFWKVTDTIDVMTPYKLRAMGISEAFLSGDSNYSNVETALSVFMENADAYRSFLTYETFTNKIFPIVAIENGFYKKGKKHAGDGSSSKTYQANNSTDLEIPVMRWHKRLAAKEEENVMDTLSTLEEKGMPIPLRMWAAAGKVDLNSYYQDLEQDKDLRDRIKKYQGGNEMEGEFSSLAGMTSPIKRLGLANRDFGETGEIKAQSKTGKDKYVPNQKKANADMNKMIVKAVLQLNDPSTRKRALSRVRGKIPNLSGAPLRRSPK